MRHRKEAALSASLFSFSAAASARLGYDFAKLLASRFPDDLLGEPLSSSLPKIVNGLALKVDDHRNGFVRVILEMDRDVFASVRIHYWRDKATAEQRTDIHSHAWDFFSFILIGCLKVTNFVEGPGNPSFRNVAPTGKRPLEHYVEGPCELKEQVSKLVTGGEVHAADVGTVHLVETIDAPSVTLFFQGPHKSSYSYFYAQEKRRVIHPVDLQSSEMELLSRELASALA